MTDETVGLPKEIADGYSEHPLPKMSDDDAARNISKLHADGSDLTPEQHLFMQRYHERKYNSKIGNSYDGMESFNDGD